MNPRKVLIASLIVLALIGSVYFFTPNGNQMKIGDDRHEDESVEAYEIYPGDVVEKIQHNEDIILLDVRTPEEYEGIHLKNALLLPVQELSAKSLADIGLGEDAKDKEIIIYCRSGARSKTAYDIMNSLGYTNIKSVAGGMIHWEEDNYPFTETGPYAGMHATVNETDTEGADMDAPRIQLDRALYDFGEVPQSGGVIQTVFTVSNGGSETLTVGDISTSCGCTSARISHTSIPPKGKALLTVFFDPNFHPEPQGKITRTVFIPTNDPVTPEAEVKIMVDIKEGI